MKKVVVTGLGIVSPLGSDVEQSWGAVVAGKSGISSITKFDTTGYPVRIAGEVSETNIDRFFTPKETGIWINSYIMGL